MVKCKSCLRIIGSIHSKVGEIITIALENVRLIRYEPQCYRENEFGIVMLSKAINESNKLKRKPTTDLHFDDLEPPSKRFCQHEFNSIIYMRVNLEYPYLNLNDEVIENRPMIPPLDSDEEESFDFHMQEQWFRDSDDELYDFWVSDDEDVVESSKEQKYIFYSLILNFEDVKKIGNI